MVQCRSTVAVANLLRDTDHARLLLFHEPRLRAARFVSWKNLVFLCTKDIPSKWGTRQALASLSRSKGVKVGSHLLVRGCPVPDVTDQESDEISHNEQVVVRVRLDRTRGVHSNIGGSIGHLVKIAVVVRPAQYAEAIRTAPRRFIEHAKTDAF
uniref:Uncharacterized protein n=1 Tax=Hyaloperonospora arabidopsidis (strain Emoy2) TaxID=559515 RepID=M4B759_HYAAE